MQHKLQELRDLLDNKAGNEAAKASCGPRFVIVTMVVQTIVGIAQSVRKTDLLARDFRSIVSAFEQWRHPRN